MGKVISNSTADTESIIKHDLCILKIYFQSSVRNVYLINSTKQFCKVSHNNASVIKVLEEQRFTLIGINFTLLMFVLCCYHAHCSYCYLFSFLEISCTSVCVCVDC